MQVAIDDRPQHSHRPLISVDGTILTHEEIAREAQHHAAATPAAAYDAAARALVVRQLLLARAIGAGLDAQPLVDEYGRRETAEDAMIRALIERDVTTPNPDEAACRRYYDNNLRRFRAPDVMELSHILFAAHPHDAAKRAAARADAAGVLAGLRSAPETFAEAARRHSRCPSAPNGGSLGRVTRGQTTPEIERAVQYCAAGEIAAEPVETRYGFHIVRLDGRTVGAIPPFDAVRERIAAYLDQSVRRRAIAQYVAMLAGQAEISGIELDRASTPLVQ